MSDARTPARVARDVRRRRAFARVVALALVAPCVVGCAASEPGPHVESRDALAVPVAGMHDAAQPDPSVFVDLRLPEDFAEDTSLAARLGAVRLLDAPGHGRVLLSFVPLAEADGAADLAAFAAAQDALFGEIVGPRDLVPLPLPQGADPFAAAQLPSVTRAYLNRADSSPDAICDAAAVRFATPGGFWTLSWNAPVGDLEAAAEPIARLLAGMTITRR